MEGLSEHIEAFTWSDFAVFVAACWIAVALILSPFFGIHWFVPGDFNYRTAMYYHGLMVLVFGLSGTVAQRGREYVASVKIMNRIAIFLNSIFGFVGVVVLGISIEFNEVFLWSGNSSGTGSPQ